MTDIIRDAGRNRNVGNEEAKQGPFEFLFYVKRHLRIVIIPVAAAMLATAFYVYAIAVPVYEATTQIYVVNSGDSIIDLSDLQMGSDLTSDYKWIFKIWEVNQQVIDNLNLPYSREEMEKRLSVENISYSRILRITFASENAKEAADVANEYAKVVRHYISEYMFNGNPTTVSAALEPLAPARPKKLLLVTVFGMLTACAALTGLFVAFLLDNKVKSASDLYRHMGIEPLAVIPMAGRMRKVR